mmetsp:Transcript_22282/g.33572  ORF Transcript_22282/g.33572 Transcript_22282/m.33572 type:complete len:201 (-) Transcript_22282:96-698(-)|eukprot:CAMPEP_0194565280 /NCGR_PEP_ID=MMETSP0292-20121207/4605_1 /TAXON_ID=39354 /ORGANISM="Heterosigma akashiwo, Strain CCMP2393" /LENGTH=200 /DNA_ID=CAMNT_0039414591 /DNA_START=846 /DNA_END=1448 /DNA_ORIENTATION=-
MMNFLQTLLASSQNRGKNASAVNEILSRQLSGQGTSASETATFAGGCFWSVELAFQRIPGVMETSVGYTDGAIENPTYKQVCSGLTGHTEAVQLRFDPNMVSFRELMVVLFNKINPTQLNGQGNDWGTQYRSGIYYHTQEQKEQAEAFVQEQQANYSAPVVVEVKAATPYYPAEEYHQQYLEKGGQSANKGCTTNIRCYG